MGPRATLPTRSLPYALINEVRQLRFCEHRKRYLHLEFAVLFMLFQRFDGLDSRRDLGEIDKSATLVFQRVDLLNVAILAEVFLDLFQSEDFKVVDLVEWSGVARQSHKSII